MENGLAIYGSFIKEIKALIYRRQYEAMKKVNTELIQLYGEIGGEIERKQREHGWGKSVVEILAKELQKEFPGMQGFSARNLWLMRNFYIEYSNLAPMAREIGNVNMKPSVAEIAKSKLQPLVAENQKVYYLTVLDDKMKLPDENPSIGIIICKNKKRTRVEYALKSSNKPIGVATYSYYENMPEEMRSLLPSPEEIAKIVGGFDNEDGAGGLLGLGDNGGGDNE